MLTHFKIDYKGWSDDASPINPDIKVKTSHNRLISQSENSEKAKKWRDKNPDKASKIASKGGDTHKTKEGRNRMSKVGTKYGAENAVKYIPIETKRRNGKNFGKKNLTSEIICEKCGKSINKGNYAKSHGNKCRELDKIKLIELLPNKFTKAIVKEIAEDNGIKNWKQLNIFHSTCPYVKIHIKVEKPNQFNPCWYKKNNKEIKKIKNNQ